MVCVKCKKEIPDGSAFCNWCGSRQADPSPTKKTKSRGNGQGSVYKTPSGKYKAVVILRYYKDENGNTRKITHSATFEKRKDAIAAIPRLLNEPVISTKKKEKITFSELYEKWLPTHRVGKSTMDCYKAAYKHFSPIWYYTMEEIDIDDLQECVDNCGKGKRTQENMKALCGLLYKYGIPRNAIPNNLNLSQFLTIGGESSAHRESFTDKQIDQIKKSIGTVDYADFIYCFIYLGFRPSEALSLTIDRYDPNRQCFVGGGKTAAGTNRIVTISPKIQTYIQQIIGERKNGYVFCEKDESQFKLKAFTEDCFYPAIEKIGIENPIVEISGGVKRHKYTPHSCRHTFSTLMKKVNAPSKDKLELIGHSSEEMLRYYQDVNIEDLKKITDQI